MLIILLFTRISIRKIHTIFDATQIGLLTLLAFFTGFGGIALVYLIMAIVVPEHHSIAEAIIRTSFST
jgi:hypothetical protein